MLAVKVIPESALERQKKRERERRSRQRRTANLENMRETIQTLECVALVSQTFDNFDELWEDFLSPDAMRVRQYLRRSLELTKVAKSLELERAQLRRLLREHQLATAVIIDTSRTLESDSWEDKTDRLLYLSRRHFKPWTIDECDAEVDAAFKEMAAFQWSLDKQTTGLDFFGWREMRRIDHARGVFQFEFDKTYRGFPVKNSVKVGWDMFTDYQTFRDVRVGQRLECGLEILQQFGPDMVIVRGAQRYPIIKLDVHVVYLVFRVETERGFLMCVRSLCCPELMKAIDGPNDMWPSNFIWSEWELLNEGGEEHGNEYKLRTGGSLKGTDPTYVNQWMVQIFGCLLRSERLGTLRQLIKSD